MSKKTHRVITVPPTWLVGLVGASVTVSAPMTPRQAKLVADTKNKLDK